MFKRQIPEWCNYFDQIFLINLKSRKDRLLESVRELKSYHIPFIRYDATYDDNGMLGLYDTMTRLFKECLDNGTKEILVFEDDVRFLQDPTPVMDNLVKNIPAWDLLYLGCNLPDPAVVKAGEPFVKISRAYATHAVAYSENAMRHILAKTLQLPFDVLLADQIQPKFNCYATYPMLCSQRDGYSNIENRVVFYKPYLEDRFNQNVREQ